jgi:solute carrier family 13 (sodium-dependent dicarboxylate transporter), member 2/3/5
MSAEPDVARTLARGGLMAGPIVAVLWLLTAGDTVPQEARVVLALAIWMAIWWMTEAVPLAVTSLLPLLVLPLFTRLGFNAVAGPYASNIVALFLGGFMLGIALQRCGLHRRIALSVLVAAGAGPRRLVGAFMAVTAVLSMWLSNTATMMMLAPIGLSVIHAWREEHAAPAGAGAQQGQEFAGALMLGIAYAASIGGMGTPIGTPPNLIMSGYLRAEYGLDITMLQWMRVALPVVALLLPAAWLWLCFVAFRLPGGVRHDGRGSEVLRDRLRQLGAVSSAERRVGVIFLSVAVCWMLRPQLARWTGLGGLDDAVIALAGALLLFTTHTGPGSRERLLHWEHTRDLPWDILLLFGGGLSLAAAINATGADAPITGMLTGLGDVAPALIMLVLALAVVFTGELTSNTAAATAMMPVLAGLCAARGLDLMPVFMVATLAGSCGFMLPVATPPNAIAYGTGVVPMRRMIRAGFGVNLIGVVIIVGYVWFVAF